MERCVRHASWTLFALGLPAAFASPIVKRGEDIVPNYDYSWVKRFAAIGDSFAAGIGVGALEGASDAKQCSRYTGGYPNRMQEEIDAEEYQFLACSGAVSKDMIEKQVPQLKGQYDLISISAGGNDVGFSDVLEACLFLPKPVCHSHFFSTPHAR
jgi:lysophospholipase L1-like esterase